MPFCSKDTGQLQIQPHQLATPKAAEDVPMNPFRDVTEKFDLSGRYALVTGDRLALEMPWRLA